jgi:hypothetical protein
MNAMFLRLVLLAYLLLGGCSLETGINALSSAEERRFAQDVVADLRSGNETRLRQSFMPAVWDESRDLILRAPSLYPHEAGSTRLVGYRRNTQATVGRGTERRQQFVLVTEGASRWTVTVLETHAFGDQPARIAAWRVTPHAERPPELAMFEASERMVPYLRAAGVGFLLVLVGILVAFIRYRRRKRSQLTR